MRIRDIRASEKRMYLRIRDVFVLTADYKPIEGDTVQFFRTVQSKLHFAANGKTAPESRRRTSIRLDSIYHD